MNSSPLTRRLTLQRLRAWLALLFLLLAVPITALVWHTYGQLKWEAFNQYRGVAEELSDRINAELAGHVQLAESRSFADYSYLVVAGDTTAPFLQRSSLSELPVVEDIPGTLGYFQIDTHGQFSTPALPSDNTPPQSVGIGPADLRVRQMHAARLLEILSENQLLDHGSGRGDDLADAVQPEEWRSTTEQDRQQTAMNASDTS
ncbi:MAG: histidine kinase, partial [Granulosicoccus sp.]|nr:histidine kinase [Granulosicoccus sp.]